MEIKLRGLSDSIERDWSNMLSYMWESVLKIFYRIEERRRMRSEEKEEVEKRRELTVFSTPIFGPLIVHTSLEVASCSIAEWWEQDESCNAPYTINWCDDHLWRPALLFIPIFFSLNPPYIYHVALFVWVSNPHRCLTGSVHLTVITDCISIQRREIDNRNWKKRFLFHRKWTRKGTDPYKIQLKIDT